MNYENTPQQIKLCT